MRVRGVLVWALIDVGEAGLSVKRPALIAAAVAVLALGAGSATGGARTTGMAASHHCVAGENYGGGRTTVYLAQGPAWTSPIVDAFCREYWRIGMRDGYEVSATPMACGGSLRGFPRISAAIFASPRAYSLVRQILCPKAFSRDLWNRFK